VAKLKISNDKEKKYEYSCVIHGNLDLSELMYIKVFPCNGEMYKSKSRCVKCLIELFENSFLPLIEREEHN
jgi:hypothetical protein